MVRWACVFLVAVFSIFCHAPAAFAQQSKRSAQLSSDVQLSSDAQLLRDEVRDLRALIATKRSQMARVARLSAHRQLDPAFQTAAQEVAQLEQQLAQRTAELVKQDTDLRQADLKTLLESIIGQLSGLNERLSKLEQVPTLAFGTLRKVEIDGAQYYLVPVEEVDQQRAPPQRASMRTKVITINGSGNE